MEFSEITEAEGEMRGRGINDGDIREKFSIPSVKPPEDCPCLGLNLFVYFQIKIALNPIAEKGPPVVVGIGFVFKVVKKGIVFQGEMY